LNQKELTKKLIKFRDDRGWKKFHTPERLAQSAHLEAGELAQLFQWGKTPPLNRIKEEIADNAIYLLYMCEKYDIDLDEIINQKISKNEVKYPFGLDHATVHGWNNT
jgi:NTP pyrophosphatase (non-canonical NTP hydrolase)